MDQRLTPAHSPEQENGKELQGVNENGSTAHGKEKEIFTAEQEDDLPEITVLA
jgi:hypothetical protein